MKILTCSNRKCNFRYPETREGSKIVEGKTFCTAQCASSEGSRLLDERSRPNRTLAKQYWEIILRQKPQQSTIPVANTESWA